jgi:hypothetical protein
MHAILLEQEFNPAGQALNSRIFLLHHLLEVKRYSVCLDSEMLEFFNGFVILVRSMQEGF